MLFKLTMTTALALYTSFVIWGDHGTSPDSEVATIQVASASAEFERPVILSGAEDAAASVTRSAMAEDIVIDAAAIVASAPEADTFRRDPQLIGEPLIVSLVQPSAPLPSEAQAQPEPAVDLYKVTGSRVNMRSGPSTSNRVVDSLVGGTLTEITAPEQNGWVAIRDVETGLTGYMAARFLEPS